MLPRPVTCHSRCPPFVLRRRRPEPKELIMRIFITGATGAIGQRLVPQLKERGHEIVASVRSAAKVDRLRALGVESVILDLLDPEAVRLAVCAARRRRHHPRGDGAGRRDRPQALRPQLRAHQRAAHARDRSPDRRRARVGRAPAGGAELHRLALRARRRADQDRGRPARSLPRALDARVARGDQAPRARGRRRGRDRAALRRVLRRARRSDAGAGAQADVPDHRRRRRHLVVAAPRRRGGRDRARGRARRAAASTTSPTTIRRRCASGCRRIAEVDRRAAAPPRSALPRAPARRRGGGRR